MNLFEITLRFNGFDIKQAKEKLRAIQLVPENEFEGYVIDQRRSIVEYHLKHNELDEAEKLAVTMWDKRIKDTFGVAA